MLDKTKYYIMQEKITIDDAVILAQRLQKRCCCGSDMLVCGERVENHFDIGVHAIQMKCEKKTCNHKKREHITYHHYKEVNVDTISSYDLCDISCEICMKERYIDLDGSIKTGSIKRIGNPFNERLWGFCGWEHGCVKLRKKRHILDDIIHLIK